MEEPSVTLNLVRSSLVIPTRGLSQDCVQSSGWGGGEEREGIIQPKAEITASISIKEETNVTGCEELAKALERTEDPVPRARHNSHRVGDQLSLPLLPSVPSSVGSSH